MRGDQLSVQLVKTAQESLLIRHRNKNSFTFHIFIFSVHNKRRLCLLFTLCQSHTHTHTHANTLEWNQSRKEKQSVNTAVFTFVVQPNAREVSTVKKLKYHKVLIWVQKYNIVNKQVTTSTQDCLELLESLSDDCRWRQASTSHWLPVSELS